MPLKLPSWLSLLIAFAATGGAPATPAAAQEVQAGWALVDITPPLGYRMSGYFRERRATGIKDPLHAKAIVLKQDDVTVALVFCDLIGVPWYVSRATRRAIEDRYGIPPERCSVMATHTHTGPLYFGAIRELLHRQAIEKHGRDPAEPVDYAAFLEERIVEAVGKALDRLRPVRLRVATVKQEPQISFNRRFYMKNGTVRFNPGQLNPNIVRPAGPIDPEVNVLVFDDPTDGRPLGALTVFAMHLDTVGGTEYSADYPYHLEVALRRRYGEGFVSFFGTGTCGDINHIDVTVRGRRSAQELGELLAGSVSRAIKAARPVDAPSLATAHRVVRVPLQHYSQAEIEEARRQYPNIVSRSLPFLERVRIYKIMALQWRGGDSIDLEVHAFRIGHDTAIVTLPGEVFVDLGLQIKRASPFKHTFVIELANDAPGYIPTEKAFREGSYETVNSRIAPGGGERLAASALEALRSLADTAGDSTR